MASTAGLALVPIFLGSSSLSIAVGARPWRWVGLSLFVGVALTAARLRGRGSATPRAIAIAGVAYLAFAFLSSTWSLDPRLTAERAVSLAVLFAGAWAAGEVCAGRSRAVAGVVVALSGGATALAVAGLVAASVSPRTGYFLATAPARFRGLGENPDTAPLVEAIALPLLVYLAIAHAGRTRLAASVAAGVVAASILLSQSRASLLAALLALLFLAVAARVPVRRRALAGTAVLAVTVGGWFGAAAIVDRTAPPVVAPSSGTGAAKRSPVASFGPRAGSLESGSGRTLAWRAALHLADRRPLGGYGFGTEALAFGPVAARLAPAFDSSFVENSYLGTYVQLGLAGVLACAALLATVVAAGVRALRRSSDAGLLAPALVAAVGAGLIEALFQSYLWSAGNVATLTLWICAALLVSLVPR